MFWVGVLLSGLSNKPTPLFEEPLDFPPMDVYPKQLMHVARLNGIKPPFLAATYYTVFTHLRGQSGEAVLGMQQEAVDVLWLENSCSRKK